MATSRRERGWSQAELAAKSGISRTEVSAIETGRIVPSVSVALRIASVLKVPVDVLFGEGAKSAPVPWAWQPHDGADARAWRASVGGRVLAYPNEATAAGVILHDALMTARGIEVVAPSVRPDDTLVVAGCDPLVGALVQEMAQNHGVRLIPLLRSSSRALDLLARGLIHVAGIHFADSTGHSANSQVVSSRLGQGHVLLHQLQWEAGVATAVGRRERSVRALLRADVRWVNREEGSAARQAFDLLLGSSRRPKGYSHIVTDHRAVAATVSSRWAEAGICVSPAAAEARIGFIGLHREAYELCIPAPLVDDRRIVALGAALRSLRYRQFVAHVPGCSSARAGEQRVVA